MMSELDRGVPLYHPRAGEVVVDVSIVALKPCPRCAAGECSNCAGDTWNEEKGCLDTCPCFARGHRR